MIGKYNNLARCLNLRNNLILLLLLIFVFVILVSCSNNLLRQGADSGDFLVQFKNIEWDTGNDLGGEEVDMYIKNIEFSMEGQNLNQPQSSTFGYIPIPETSPQWGFFKASVGSSYISAVNLRGSSSSLKINVHAKMRFRLSGEKYIRFIMGIDKDKDGYFTMMTNSSVGNLVENEVYTFYGIRYDIDENSVLTSDREDYYSVYSSITIPIVPDPGEMKLRLAVMDDRDDSFGVLVDGLRSCVNVRQGAYDGFDEENDCLNQDLTAEYLIRSFDNGHLVDTSVIFKDDHYAMDPLDESFYINRVGVDVSPSSVFDNEIVLPSIGDAEFAVDNTQNFYYNHGNDLIFYTDGETANNLKVKINIGTANSSVTYSRIAIGIDKNNDGLFRKLTHAFSRNSSGWLPSDNAQDYLSQDEVFLIEPPKSEKESSFTFSLDSRFLREVTNRFKVRMSLHSFYDRTFVNSPLGSTLCGTYGIYTFDEESCFVRNVDINFLEFPYQKGNVIDFDIVILTQNPLGDGTDYPPPPSFSICDYYQNGNCMLTPTNLQPTKRTAPWAKAVFNGYMSDRSLFEPAVGRVVIENLPNPYDPPTYDYYYPSIYMDPGELTYDQIYFMKPHNTYDKDVGDGISSITHALDIGFRAIEIDIQGAKGNNGWRTVRHNFLAPSSWNYCEEDWRRGDLKNCMDKIVEWLDRDNRQPNGGWGGPITVWLDTKLFLNWLSSGEHERDAKRFRHTYGDRIITPVEIRNWLREKNGNPNISLRQGIKEYGWPQLKYMDGRNDNNPDYQDMGDLMVILTGDSWSIDDYGKDYADSLIFFPCMDSHRDRGNFDILYEEEDEYTAQQVCINAKWDKHLEKKLWLADKYNFLIHTFGETDLFSRSYVGVAFGSQFISRDNWNNNHQGHLPRVGIRRSVPGVFEIKYKSEMNKQLDEKCLAVDYIGEHKMWENGIKMITKDCGIPPKNIYLPELRYTTVMRYSAEGQLRLLRFGNHCLDIKGAQAKTGSLIHKWDCDGGDSEKWKLGYDGRFYSYLENNKYFRPIDLTINLVDRTDHDDYYEIEDARYTLQENVRYFNYFYWSGFHVR